MFYICCYKYVKIMETKLEITFEKEQFDDIDRVLFILGNEGWDLKNRIDSTTNCVHTKIKIVMVRKMW